MQFLLPLVLLAGIELARAVPADKAIRQSTNGPNPGTIIWICSDIPDVCMNMCYGAYCRDYGTSLNWDNYAGNSKGTRADNAGCGRDNHCSTDPPTTDQQYQCGMSLLFMHPSKTLPVDIISDEYPFGSTSDADRTDRDGAVNRCVPRSQNARQGAYLRQLYKSEGNWRDGQGLNNNPPARFSQTFSKAGDLHFCRGDGSDCDNDGFQFDKNGLISGGGSKKRAPAVHHEHNTYRLRSGREITVPNEFKSGNKVLLPSVHNATLFQEHTEKHVRDLDAGHEQYDYMLENLYLEEDYVERKL